MMKHLMQLTIDVYVNDYGEICTVQDDTVLTKPFLALALKYNTEEDLATQWNISVEIIETLKEVYHINLKPTDRLTRERIKIMQIIQRHIEKTGIVPTLKYLLKRSKFKEEDLLKEIKILSQKGYLQYTNGSFSVLRAV
ncbi:hypothetical protein ACFYU8_17895 [Brevibacillus sp. NPDC003359]|uniref:LexA family protein n=1 Tax=unclassified Brevibacillus TaxID=2684853 RepID=UPI0036BAF0F0